MSKKSKKETPLMKQYNAIKKRYPGALLLFRVGDFYETFGDDAVTSSQILGITLTKRANGAASEIPLAGFPHHALDNYLPKLVRAGQRVAICDQLEDPKSAIGVVKRGVTELVTPGVSLNDNVLESKQNNFLAALHQERNLYGVAFLDISTGEFLVAQGQADYVDKLFQNFQPSEVLHCRQHKASFHTTFGDKLNTYCLDEWVFQYDFAFERLTQHFGTSNLKGFGTQDLSVATVAAGCILHYLAETEHHDIRHIARLSRIEEERYVWLDKFTIRNLELIAPQQEGGIPLIDVLDHTVTPMGGRLMRKWTVLPLKERARIEDRLSIVEALVSRPELTEALLQLLKPIGDLERLISKVAARRINPREMAQLKRALRQIAPLKETLRHDTDHPRLHKVADQLNDCAFLLDEIERHLKDELPLVTNQGGMIRTGIHEELDKLHAIAYSGKDYLVQLQQREAQNTGISSLKVAFNKVFGYYLEVTHAHKKKVPNDWIRKQTLVNAERYITPELKEYEEKILHAEEKIFSLEQELFNNLMLTAADYVPQVQQNARLLAMLDCLLSFARLARKNRYVKPDITDGHGIAIVAGRHPVIEQQLPAGESYVPNDIFLDDTTQQILIITGPNMAGKSALLRQTALIVLMAQMGSFVPAEAASLGVVDKVFTRVGASDNLSRGESTFMVEMTETASILNNLSERSLVLMDEIGRGTSTYDGISIAWSIVEYLHNHRKFRAKTLFATHYHELNQLAEDFPRVRNFNVSVKEAGNKVIFMRKLKEGGSEHSFGIHVAQMAGMPTDVVLRANEVMHHLEKDKADVGATKQVKTLPKNNFQLSMFELGHPELEQVREKLDQVEINTMSPVEALLKLQELKLMLEKREKV
ncbi:DNA mismatch repair protein MutS [Catalinimonas alkaloidigena]|uniref:DNA mismatch repair protein MutS n=1 Tax=Catalinimonas alkaloidigena TaxID=1075417 RepID=A0A1G9M428_9BACT|nr:DNA mismatch repair protein MutS [Catalinimonas alkaloidigena]SDL68873.1 DNA mismatch repair protein MutS [Catalinimonas alkaloidigena]